MAEGLEGFAEATLFSGEVVIALVKIEHCGHEVLGARVLVQTAHQIPHGGIKFARMNHWRVDDQATDGLTHRIGLIRRHANQHLAVNSTGDTTVFGQSVRECEVKKVVASDTDPQRLGPSRR